MTCRNCGNEMRDDARFCPSCGALNSPDTAGGQPQGGASYSAPAWEGPEGGGKKKKTGLLIGIAVAAAAVIALLVFVLGGLFSSPKGTVEKAVLKSAAAYAAAEEKLGLPDMQQWQQDQEITQSMGLELRGINSDLAGYDLSALNGLGLGLLASYSGENRTLFFDLGAHWGEDDLFTFRMAADGAELYFNSPQLMGDTYYGMNTETLGTDLWEMTGEDEVKNFSFNMFDLVDLVTERMDQKAMEEDFKAANKSLWDQAQVKKLGARTLHVNGTETKTTAYQVTIPQEALFRYVDDLETLLSVLNYYDLYEELYQSMGMPQDQIDEILSSLEELDVYGELADGLRDVAGELGDVELEVCLSGGYVSAVRYEGKAYNSELSVDVYLGGNEEYVDDLSVEVEVDGNTVEVKSTGDHGLKGGTYTDETTVRVRTGGSTLARVTSELTIDPGRKTDNLQWKLGVDSSGLSIFVLEAAGDLSMDKDFLSLHAEDVGLRAVGMEVCTLAFDYEVENHAQFEAVENTKLISRMNEDELEQMVLDTQNRAMQWASEMENLFLTRLPSELLWAMMY